MNTSLFSAEYHTFVRVQMTTLLYLWQVHVTSDQVTSDSLEDSFRYDHDIDFGDRTCLHDYNIIKAKCNALLCPTENFSRLLDIIEHCTLPWKTSQMGKWQN